MTKILGVLVELEVEFSVPDDFDVKSTADLLKEVMIVVTENEFSELAVRNARIVNSEEI